MKVKIFLVYTISFLLPLAVVASIPRIMWADKLQSAQAQYKQIIKQEEVSHHIYKNCMRVSEHADPRYSMPIVDATLLVSCLKTDNNYQKLLPSEAYFVFGYIQMKDIEFMQSPDVAQIRREYLLFIDNLYASSTANMNKMLTDYSVISDRINIEKCNFLTCFKDVYYFAGLKSASQPQLSKTYAEFLSSYNYARITISCMTECEETANTQKV